MRKSQWFVFAIVFLLTAIIFQHLGASADSTSMSEENLRELTKAEEENTWTETFGILHLSKENSANTLFIVSQVHYAVSNFCWAIFIACISCGFIEPRAEKKKLQSSKK